MRHVFLTGVAALLIATTASAGEKSLSEGVSVFGGVFSESSFPGNANVPFGGDFEDNYNFGAIYNRDLMELGWGSFVGLEVGASVRFGEADATSGEVWAGASFRHHGVDFGAISFAPRLTVGLSAVSDTIGIETERAARAGSDGTMLFYLGTELATSFASIPTTEFFYRTHHRSGANGTLENMSGGHNAHIFGVRKNF